MERFVSVACLVLMVAGVSACVAESSDTVGDGDGSDDTSQPAPTQDDVGVQAVRARGTDDGFLGAGHTSAVCAACAARPGCVPPSFCR